MYDGKHDANVNNENIKNNIDTKNNADIRNNITGKVLGKRTEKVMQKKETNRIIKTLFVIGGLFIVIIAYLTYFVLFVGNKYANNPYNRRQWAQEDSTLRGTIFDKNGVVLAYSEMNGESESQERIYPYGDMYCHVIGYNSRSYGKTLLESSYNKYLLNITDDNPVMDIKDMFKGDKKVGNNLKLTIDHTLQEKAYELLGARNGAVVVMSPKTGEILAMVSKPGFDPNGESLAAQWVDLIESKENPFVARAYQGLYAPGSTFKVVTAVNAIENGMDDLVMEDTGSIVFEGKEIRNYGGTAYGTLDLRSALMVSSNVYFSQLGVNLGGKRIMDMANRIGMNKDIPFDLPVNKSRFTEPVGKLEAAHVSMGQGKTLVTPLHMAMIASAIANDGIMMKPYIVSEVVSSKGDVILSTRPSELNKCMETEAADMVKYLMKRVVDSGTGTGAAIPGISVSGKTGTAENELSVKEGGKEHAWFIGFAPTEDPVVAVAVIAEYSGSTGGAIAAPIAGQLMAAYLSSIGYVGE